MAAYSRGHSRGFGGLPYLFSEPGAATRLAESELRARSTLDRRATAQTSLAARIWPRRQVGVQFGSALARRRADCGPAWRSMPRGVADQIAMAARCCAAVASRRADIDMWGSSDQSR